MHLFLYKASRHEKPKSYYGSRRLVQGTYRNDFDLDLIKAGIKGRYTILPHGSNAFQARLKDFGLEEEFYGHIIEVPEARNAIWFKLNYDNIGKPGTVYKGSWKHLDVSELSKHDVPYQELIKELTQLRADFQNVKYHSGTLAHFLSGRHSYSEHMEKPKAQGQIYLKSLDEAAAQIGHNIKRVEDDVNHIRQQIRNYMKAQEL